MLVLAHREELLEQAKDKLLKVDPTLKVEIEKADQFASEEADVVVASVATLGRKWSKRLERFDRKKFGIVVIDECHHSVASWYANIIKHFGLDIKGNLDAPVLLWVTATPNRRDNIGLDTIFDTISYKYDIKRAIDEWNLVDIRAYTVFTGEDLKDVHTLGWDFKIDELAEAVDSEKRNKLVADKYIEVCEGKKAVVFSVNIAHAHAIAWEFKAKGIKAVAISWESEDRKEILEKFKNDEIKVLVNCNLLTEGFDEPSIEAILMARPTTSTSLWTQMIGRGTRLFPWKDHVKIIDFVDNLWKHDIVTCSSLIDVEQPIKANGESILAYKDKLAELLMAQPWVDLKNVSLWDIDSKLVEVDIFKMAEIPQFIKKNSKNAWQRLLDGYRISLWTDESGNGLEIKIVPNAIGQYDIEVIQLVKQIPSFKNWFQKVIAKVMKWITAWDIQDAIEKADQLIESEYWNRKAIVSQNARWRTEPPTEGQLRLLKKFGYFGAEKLSKGEASNLIQKHITENPRKKKSFK